MFHVSLLEQDITRKGRIDKIVIEFDVGNIKKYKAGGIWDNAIYVRELEAKSLPELDYLIAWKSYSKEKNI